MQIQAAEASNGAAEFSGAGILGPDMEHGTAHLNVSHMVSGLIFPRYSLRMELSMPGACVSKVYNLFFSLLQLAHS